MKGSYVDISIATRCGQSPRCAIVRNAALIRRIASGTMADR